MGARWPIGDGPAGKTCYLILSGPAWRCSLSRDRCRTRQDGTDGQATGFARPGVPKSRRPEADSAFASKAAPTCWTKGRQGRISPALGKPQSGARGSVTPIAAAYTSEGAPAAIYLASYVERAAREAWMQGARAIHHGQGENSHPEAMEKGLSGGRCGPVAKNAT